MPMISSNEGFDGPKIQVDGVSSLCDRDGLPLPLGGGSQVVGETPSGIVNNSNATFTTAFAFVPASVELFINGVRQKRILDFTTTGTTTVLTTDSPLTGELLQLNYERP